MRFILNATNLLGDSLYLLRPIEVFLQQSKDVECIVADKGLSYELFANTFQHLVAVLDDLNEAKERWPEAVVLDLNAGRSGEWCHKIAREENWQPHMSEGYAHFLGVDLKGDLHPPMRWSCIEDVMPRTFYAISPFSKSCSRHSGETPNKTLDAHKWEYILRYLRRQNKKVIVVGGPNDKLANCSVPLNDYFCASSLFELEFFLKSCALLVGVDNGLMHIASVLDTPCISLWPKVSNMHFIGPRFSAKTAFVLMEPNSAQPSQLLCGIRKFAKILLADKDVTVETVSLAEDGDA
jgi:hypothetical protein